MALIDDEAYKSARTRIKNAIRRGQKSLSLRGKGLKILPREIGQLVSLQELDLRGNELTQLPPEIGQLVQLLDLNLDGNQIQTLPPQIGQLISLLRLVLSRNQLNALPPEIGNLGALQQLALSENQLRALPAEFWRLTSLRVLYLDRNQLNMLPPEIARMSLMHYIDLDENLLRTLPPEIGQLELLHYLDVAGNELNSLPPEIGQLASLKGLNLSRNQLSALPPEMGHLRSLSEAAEKDTNPRVDGLSLEGNLLPDPYPRLIAPGQPAATSNVLAWLRGELDPEGLREGEDESDRPELDPVDQIEENDELADIDLEQRPAAFRFGLRNGRIDALPEESEAVDLEAAQDLYGELVAKAQVLGDRLEQTNSDKRARLSVKRLIAALGSSLEEVRPGILLSRSRSIEADRNAFNTPEATKELFPEAIAMMDDLLLSLQDLLAVYPIVRRIESEQLALHIQRNPKLIERIQTQTDAIKASASESEAVTESATAALSENDDEIEQARDLAVKAGSVAYQLLVFRNFLNLPVRIVRDQSAKVAAGIGRAASRAGNELKELGEKSWEEFKDNFPKGVGQAGRVLPLLSLIGLLGAIAGPAGALAGSVPAFRPVAKAIKRLLRENKKASARSDREGKSAKAIKGKSRKASKKATKT